MTRFSRPAFRYLALCAGILCTAAPFPLFFIPNRIAPGGVTGIGTLLHALWGWPVGLLAVVLNVPLFLIGWRRMGRAFLVKSLVGTVGVSLAIDCLPLGSVTEDPILAAVFGGVLMGLGVGLVIRAGATTGGSDMAATLLHKRWSAASVGAILLGLDGCVIAASGLVFGVQSAMYALISVFLSARVVDRVVEGLGAAKAFFVFSGKTEAIAQAVMGTLGRGATLLHARGAYTAQEQDVLLCVVTRRQIPQFKAIVAEADALAFVMVTDVREALGEGFTRAGA